MNVRQFFFNFRCRTEICIIVVCLSYYVRHHLVFFLVNIFFINFDNKLFYLTTFSRTFVSPFHTVVSHVVALEEPTPTVTTQGLSTTSSFATLCCIGVYNLFTMYYAGLRQGNWETRCGYVYGVTIRLKDHADQLWCVVPIPQSTTLDQR